MDSNGIYSDNLKPIEDENNIPISQDTAADRVLDRFTRERYPGYTYVGVSKQFCPLSRREKYAGGELKGPQAITNDPTCWLWSLFLMYMRLKCPHLDTEQTYKDLAYVTSVFPKMMRHWSSMLFANMLENHLFDLLMVGYVIRLGTPPYGFQWPSWYRDQRALLDQVSDNVWHGRVQSALNEVLTFAQRNPLISRNYRGAPLFTPELVAILSTQDFDTTLIALSTTEYLRVYRAWRIGNADMDPTVLLDDMWIAKQLRGQRTFMSQPTDDKWTARLMALMSNVEEGVGKPDDVPSELSDLQDWRLLFKNKRYASYLVRDTSGEQMIVKVFPCTSWTSLLPTEKEFLEFGFADNHGDSEDVLRTRIYTEIATSILLGDAPRRVAENRVRRVLFVWTVSARVAYPLERLKECLVQQKTSLTLDECYGLLVSVLRCFSALEAKGLYLTSIPEFTLSSEDIRIDRYNSVCQTGTIGDGKVDTCKDKVADDLDYMYYTVADELLTLFELGRLVTPVPVTVSSEEFTRKLKERLATNSYLTESRKQNILENNEDTEDTMRVVAQSDLMERAKMFPQLVAFRENTTSGVKARYISGTFTLMVWYDDPILKPSQLLEMAPTTL